MRKLFLILLLFSSLISHAAGKLVSNEQLYGTWEYSNVIPLTLIMDKKKVDTTSLNVMKEMTLNMEGTETYHRNNTMSDRGTISITYKGNDLKKVSCNGTSKFNFSQVGQELTETIIVYDCSVINTVLILKEQIPEYAQKLSYTFEEKLTDADNFKDETSTTKLHYISQDEILTEEVKNGLKAVITRKK